MRGADKSGSIGELIRIADGTAWPLVLPITLIGSGTQCDIRMAEDAVAELHCALTLTPAGLALRSWAPDATSVDGQATAAALLHDGQELLIGSQPFRLNWKVEPKPDLLDQVRGSREALREERKRNGADLDRRTKRLAKAETVVREDERAVALERKRVRAIYRRCLQRIKSRWASERTSAGEERANLEDSQDRFREYADRRRTELERLGQRLGDDKARLQAAWELLAEGQRRAIADRQQTEDWLARQRDTHDLRTKMLHEQQTSFETNRLGLESRQPMLLAEIAGLEARATHLRQAVAQLDAKREQKQIAGERSDSFANSSVSLEPSRQLRGVSHQADALLGELQLGEQELARERQAQANIRSELEIQAAELADERAILTEQIAALSAARNSWQSAEAETVEELHSLALGVRSGEQTLDERDRELQAAERRRRREDHSLVELRFKLENWQMALAAKESSVQSEADGVEARLGVKREQVDRWERSLGVTASSWADLRRREIAFLHAELDHLAQVKAEHVSATADARRVHAELTDRLVEVAARDLASTGERRGATRRVRALEKRWAAHFRREEKRQADLEIRLQRDRHTLDDRIRQLQQETNHFLERQLTESLVRTAHDRERLTIERTLHEARDEAELETQLRFRTEAEARHLRSEIARMAHSILTANLTSPDEPDAIILPLQTARAA